ncbi:MAG: gliding motility lipoprotein GldH [Prevotella ruminicola]|jgi:gliding motility-associated lipoprotein GldH|uniref:Gliding motility lipoprotein GldH n=1 Tax=Xylanibacter ruminicola TaxID=839 RepID=A0A9D5NZR0_XYLRU|nr:gliding motility lipoprotein GldH [Xylanibacter ruminicola]
MRNKAITLILAMAGLLMMVACDRTVVYNHYEHVDNEGWERTDTMHFYVSPIKHAGTYSQQLMLRTNNQLPFLGISVIVEQDIYPAEQSMGRKLRKRIDCHLVEKNGHILGNGISCYQYTFNVDSLQLNEGDSLHMYVMHYMKQENMPGISDVGILISQ